jgi:cell filamentation protein, protein adenylyltransferase
VNNDVDPYLIPGTKVLRNRLGISDARRLDRIERRLVADRIAEGAPIGAFDLAHLRAIHRHLFQDVYDWAGELRTVEINKGGHQFQFQRYIQTGMSDVHRRLVQAKFLKGLEANEFARQAGVIIGDVNYVHPFREGNGRTQAQYLKQLAAQAGHELDLRRIDPALWIEASKASHGADYELMARVIRRAIAIRSKR